MLETVAEPDVIQQGDFGELLAAVRFYEQTPLTRKHVVVAYREIGSDDWLYRDGLPGATAIDPEGSLMQALKILEKPSVLQWDYDEEADVLYLSVGEPRPAVGTDIGEGLVVRYDEMTKEVVGLTLVGLRARVLKSLTTEAK